MRRGGEQLHRSFPPHEPDSPPGSDNVHAFGPIDGESKKSQKALGRCTMYNIFILYR